MSTDTWLIRPHPRSSPALRLICLPYAGGSASIYCPWGRHLPDSVELIAVQPPGRASRIAEPPCPDMQTLVGAVGAALAMLPNCPYVLFGHSLGSRVAYALGMHSSMLGLVPPRLLIASGSRAPHLPGRRAPVHDLPDDLFKEWLRAFGGTPHALLDDAEFMDLLMPALRADFSIADQYRAEPAPLPCPVQVLTGSHDTDVTPEESQAWMALSNGHCDIHSIDGGHFFIHSHAEQVLSHIKDAISPLLPLR
ncbi:alpha/beta fold hydrolase [Luteimonas sp. XNQY3]|nr:alpha/beta fold hydrolase [Luteimonas sp. XNQY3]MCD9006287.1 alpha/beta fold hydrolase [Luteimonas sp. XNQY3]